MNNKIITFILSICLIIPAIFCFPACMHQSDPDLGQEEVFAGFSKEDAYNLYRTTLLDGNKSMNNIAKYKVRYEYDDRVEYESYNRLNFTYSYKGQGGAYCDYWNLSQELKLNNRATSDGAPLYSLKINSYNSSTYISMISYETYCNDNTFEEVLGSYSFSNHRYGNESSNKIHSFIRFMLEFKYSDILNFEFDTSLNLKISFKYIDNDDNEYVYEYFVNNEGEIQKCYVYENDPLENKKGELCCKINYIANESDITLDMVKNSLDVIMQSFLTHDPTAYQTTDVFGYKFAY